MDADTMLDCLTDRYAAALPLYAMAPSQVAALREHLSAADMAYLDASGFSGKPQEWRLLPGGSGIAGAVLGLGEASPTPWSFGALPQALPEGTVWQLADNDHAEAATLGWCLGAYRYVRFKSPARAPAKLVRPAKTAAALRAAEAAWLVRDLINAPANILGPAELAAAAAELAQRHGAKFDVILGDALTSGFPALAAVGQASPRAPRVAVLEWRPNSRAAAAGDLPLVALCGKGVCFDTGGLDLKPSAGMLRMKKDMGGAATMLGLADMIMGAELPVRLLVLLGAVENSVAGNAFRPMDVLSTRAGLSVEVGNTDAEGRLVLADLLTYACERHPTLLVDCATLTGAARVALGPDLPALFTPDDDLAAQVLSAGRASHDPLWRLPLHDGYDAWLESSVADINNVATKPMAGAIIAGLFLRRFVVPGIPWIHLDVYAWNDAPRPGRPEGGEAQALRALFGAIGARFADGPGVPR
jgi:leucyl aminopeptidase